MFDLTGKVALITGASRGMGESHARILARQGAKVIVTGRDEDGCVFVAEDITKNGAEAVSFKMDVTNTQEINSVFDKVIEQFGRLDILVNNAGIYEPVPFLDMSEEQWDRTIDINLKGQFMCAQRAAKEMAKNKWGRIINIASIASGQVGVGVEASAHYTASKGGVIGMTETLAIELGPLGITVNAIGPGAIDTPMISDSGMSQEETNAMLARLPIQRIGKSEEISALVVYLASDEASYTTGATFFVDGGWLAT